MKSLFEEMGGTYRQEGDYLIPNLALPDEPEYQIGKYGRMRRSYLKEHRPVLYASLLTSGTLHRRPDNRLSEGIRARAIDIDETGGLVVEYLEGIKSRQMETLSTGEITVRKVYD